MDEASGNQTTPTQVAIQPIIPWIFSLIWLFTLGVIALFWDLGAIGLVDETEPLFAEAARQMTVTGDWITPYFNGEPRFDKPPLIYWAITLLYRTIGVNPWAVRLPSALAALLLSLLGFYTLHRLSQTHSRRFQIASCIAGTLIVLNPQTIAWARMGVSDMLLSACIGSALLAFFTAYTTPETQPKNRWYLAFYLFLALAVLTKGPVGIVLPSLIIFSFLLYLGNLTLVLGEMKLRSGVVLFLGITLPWYILVTWANGWNFIHAFFGYHNVERFTSVVNNHSAPWYFYIPTVIVGFFPWSVYLPVAIAKTRFWQRKYWIRQPRTQHISLFAFFWFLCILLFFTVAVTKLPSYTLPLIPACAILVALVWSEPEARYAQLRHSWLFWTGIANAILSLAIAALLPLAVPALNHDPAMPHFGTTLRDSGFILQASGHYLILGLALLVAVGGKWWRGLWTVNAIAFIAFILFIVTPVASIMDQQRQLPLRELAHTITQNRQPNEPLIMVGFWKPSLTFYTQQNVIYGHHTGQSLVTLGNLIQEPQTPNTLLILGQPETINNMGFAPQPDQILNQQGTYQLVRVTKAEIINTLNQTSNHEIHQP